MSRRAVSRPLRSRTCFVSHQIKFNGSGSVTVFPSAVALMREIAASRAVFHSEADFQHTLAWQIHRHMPEASVTLERPYRTADKTLHLDLLVKSSGMALAVELKYKTCELNVDGMDDAYVLRNQSAQDLGRYDFIKDVWRLEEITDAVPNCQGLAILLTNDAGYWNPSKRLDTVDASFRISEGVKIGGEMGWGSKASAGTMRGRERAISLRQKYLAAWSDYSKLSSVRNGTFRYLALIVDPGSAAK